MAPFDYALTVLICILCICAFLFLTETEYGEKPKIYSRGYVILFGIASFVPYFNVFLGIFLFLGYICSRGCGVLKLKRTKFTEKWFGVEE